MGSWTISLLLSSPWCVVLRALGLPESSILELSGVLPRAFQLSSKEVYALLSAAGCPRLGFLLTDLDPRDPVEEAINSWKQWLTIPYKYERDGETRMIVGPCGFLVHTSYLVEPLDEEMIAKWMGSDAELDARMALDREIERLIELAEAGFEGPAMEGFFDRYIDAVAELEGWYEDALRAGASCSEEELRELLALGAGEPSCEPVWAPDGSLVELRVRAKRASELPAEVKEKLWRQRGPELLGTLKDIARLLAVLRFARVYAFLFFGY
jgi:hypothetical protein